MLSRISRSVAAGVPPGRLRRRALLAALGAAGATALLSACGAQSSSATETVGRSSAATETAPHPTASPRAAPSPTAGAARVAGGATTIQFWPTWGGQFQVDGMKKVLAAFEQQAPGIAVELTPFQGKFDKIYSAVAAGTAPDVVTLSGATLTQFARRQAIQPLDDRLQASTVVRPNEFADTQLTAASWTGKLYGFPAWENGPSPFLFWNKMHFQEKGLPADQPPTTLDQALDYAAQLNQMTSDGQITRLGWEPLAEVGSDLLGYWAGAYGVTWYDDQAKKISLDQSGLIEALDYLKPPTSSST